VVLLEIYFEASSEDDKDFDEADLDDLDLGTPPPYLDDS